MTATTGPRITLLDGFSIDLGERARDDLAHDLPHAAQRLVAHLCLSGRPPRAALAGRLWPDVPEHQAFGSLRSALWRLQKVAPGVVDTSGSGVSLAAGVCVDVQELGEWARRVTAGRWGPDDVEVPAVGLSGDLLPGWYEDWVLFERERLRQMRMHALELVARRLAELGRHGAALEAAYAAVRAEPLRESAHRTVVRVHLAEGNVVEAVRSFEYFRALLEEELGVGPSDQMLRLIRTVNPGSSTMSRTG